MLIKTKEEIISAQAKSAIFRSKCTWYKGGEKSMKYFLNLEKNRAKTKSMTILIEENGTVIFYQK